MNIKVDEIIDEIRRVREEHAASLDYDVKRITQDLQRQERESRQKIVDRSPRKPFPVQNRRSV